jgi:hypothetical protein
MLKKVYLLKLLSSARPELLEGFLRARDINLRIYHAYS